MRASVGPSHKPPWVFFHVPCDTHNYEPVWAACMSSASTAMSCYGCVSATRSVHATSLSLPVVSLRCLTHAVCNDLCGVLKAAVCCHVRVTVLQCAVMSACSHPLTRCVSSGLSHSATHAVQIAVSRCRVQVDRISIEASFCSVFNDREHRPADGQPPELEAVLARPSKLEHLQRNIECIVLTGVNIILIRVALPLPEL